jgi:antirestriction protein ArdC
LTDQRQLADRVLKELHEAVVPWRYPNNVMPEFALLFGQFFTGEPLTEAQVDYAELDAIIAATGARITHHWRCPKPRCDRPPLDRILLPPRSRFINDQQYHASRIHEVVHYLESGRVGWIGSDHQAELVAECATGFLEAHLRLPHDDDNTNINKWLPKWAEGIEADPAYLLNAVAFAERSVNYLLDLRRRRVAA